MYNLKLNLSLKSMRELKTLLNRINPNLKVERIRIGLPLEKVYCNEY